MRSMKSRMSCRRSVARSRRVTHFAENAGAQTRLQSLRGRKIDGTAENVGQAIPQGCERKKIRGLLKFNGDVDVAIRPSLAPRDRSIDAEPPHASARQFVAVRVHPLEELVGHH